MLLEAWYTKRLLRLEVAIGIEETRGCLRCCLSSYEAPAVELHLVCPNREQVSPAVIAFRELLREKVKQIISL